MSIYYVIKQVHRYKSKRQGNVEIMTTYFQRQSFGIMNCMVSDPSEAKHYEFAMEAGRDVTKYFKGRKGISIKKITTKKNEPGKD